MIDEYVSTMNALGVQDGYILDWRRFGGCQLMSQSYKEALSCAEREAVWQCEVIGPHRRHRWSDHLKAHERYGNGHSCRTVGDSLRDAMTRLYPWSRLGVPMGQLDHDFEGDGPHCTGWIESQRGSEAIGIIMMRIGCGYPRSAHRDAT